MNILRKIICLTVIVRLCQVLPAQDCTHLFPVVPPEKGFSPDTATVCILGDMMMHSGQIARGGFDKSLRLIRPYIESANVAIANMEVTFAGKPYSGYPCFSAPDSYAGTTAEAGVDVFLMANNHILDKGMSGLKRTVRLYDSLSVEKGIFYTGLDGKELYIRANGIRLCLYNATYGTNVLAPKKSVTNTYDTNGNATHNGKGTATLKESTLNEDHTINLLTDSGEVKAAINRGAGNSDLVIALPHWGNEYVLTHNISQQRHAENLADWGSDIIVGSHPHVVQDCDTVTAEDGRKVPVVYSLGNAVSNMSAENTQLEQMAILTIARDAVTGTRICEVKLVWLWCSRPGGFDEWYTVVPVEEFIGRRHEWKNASDYDRMVRHFNRRTVLTH